MPDLRSLFGRRGKAAPEPKPPDAEPAGRPLPQPEADTAEMERTRRQLDAIRQKREAESMLPVAGSCLFQLYRRFRGFAPPSMGDKYSMAVFMEGALLPEAEQKLWIMGIEREARTKPQYNPPARPGPSTPPETAAHMLRACEAWEAASADAQCYCRVSADGLAAWIFVLPPVNGGAGPSEEELYALLQKQGVNYGVLAGRILEICQSKNYLMLVQVAAGQPPVHGVDGDVIDHFKRAAEIELLVREDGTVDFRDLGWLQTVCEGEVICDILPPSPPESGTDVRGRPIAGRPGRWPSIPRGHGTHLAEGDTLLLASIDGVVSFSSQHFRVEPLLVVKGDVDIAVGNLDVVGGILVHGDVLEGFSLRATGSITVKGMVEAACVEAGGSIQVGLGINGNGVGEVRAGGDLISKFIESARVVVGGRVLCESIVNSTVSSDDAVLATQGRGVIIGGEVTARNLVEAKILGNRSSRSLSVHLGDNVAFVQEKREVARRRGEVAAEIAEKEKNIRYIMAGGRYISPAELDEMEDLKSGVKALKMQLTALEARQAEMLHSYSHNPQCRLVAAEVNPPVELYIAGAETLITEPVRNAAFRQRGGEIIEQSEKGAGRT